MDFFGHQDQARRNTRWLQCLFVLAVTITIIGIYWVLTGTIAWHTWWSALEAGQQATFAWSFLWNWNWTLLAWVALFCLVVVALGCAIKFMELHSGGAWVAELLGGKRLDPASPSDEARTLLNVVEEMALASGMAPPPVYLLDREKGINAFAAGYEPEDAVIGVTRGAMTQLTRDELQGVIGHEFSHILHGDMRLNLEMIGLLNGLQGLGVLGRTMLNWSLNHSAYKSNFFTPLHGLSILFSFIFGGALRMVGSIGVVSASMVKSAVSRQREFLADAAAVQFTRNPEGLGNALKKIGGLEKGSVIQHEEAPQVSHMFFSQGIFMGLDSLFATHPPLLKRIQRIEPTFVAKNQTAMTIDSPAPLHVTGNVLSLAAAPTQSGSSCISSERPTPESIVQQIGESHPDHVSYVHDLLAQVPESIQQAVHEPFGARAVVYTLLLSSNPQIRTVQKNRLASHADSEVYQEALKLEPEMLKIDPAVRLPLIDMAIPALKQLSSQQYEMFKANVVAIIPKKDQDALFGWTLRRILLRHLDPYFSTGTKPNIRYNSLKRIAHHCGDLLSALAHHGKGNADDIMRAFRAGKQELGTPTLTLTPASQGTLASLDLTLYTLAGATPQIKRTILKACAACVLADLHVTIEEGELLRAIADSLGCPMPPLFTALPKNAQAHDSPPVPQHSAQTSTPYHGEPHDYPRTYAQVH